MRLEEEIKQKEFKTNYNKAVVNIIYTFSWLDASIKDFLKDYGITSQQFNILRILRGQYPNPSTINILKDRMLDKMCDASRLVERLRVKGLVKRTQASLDKRAVDITITQKGLDLLAKIDIKYEHFEQQFHTITEQEANTLNDLLDKLRG